MGASPAIVQLDPVVVLALRIGHIPTVGGQHLVDHDGTIAGGQALFDLGEQDDGHGADANHDKASDPERCVHVFLLSECFRIERLFLRQEAPGKAPFL